MKVISSSDSGGMFSSFSSSRYAELLNLIVIGEKLKEKHLSSYSSNPQIYTKCSISELQILVAFLCIHDGIYCEIMAGREGILSLRFFKQFNEGRFAKVAMFRLAPTG